MSAHPPSNNAVIASSLPQPRVPTPFWVCFPPSFCYVTALARPCVGWRLWLLLCSALASNPGSLSLFWLCALPKATRGTQVGRVLSSLTIIMSDPNHPPPYPYSSYPGQSDPREHDASLGDWAGSQYSQPFFGPQLNYETIAGFPESPSGTSGVNINERSMNSKVPIPRSAQPNNWTSSGRVSRACENCREQKAKCSGHRPTCQRCQEAGIACSYGDRKREKVAKCVMR